MPSPNTPFLTAFLKNFSDKLGWMSKNQSPSAHALPKHPRFNNYVTQDLPFHNSRIDAFKPPLYSAIIQGPYSTNIPNINKSEYRPY